MLRSASRAPAPALVAVDLLDDSGDAGAPGDAGGPSLDVARSQLWDTVRQVVVQLKDSGGPGNLAAEGPAVVLGRLLQLHERCLVRERWLRRSHVALMVERNLYLSKLRAVEEYGQPRGWGFSSPTTTGESDARLLRDVYHALYADDQQENS
jgi:hypothetical protein